MNIVVKRDNGTSSAVIELLESHLIDMQGHTPPSSVHALDLGAYQSPSLITRTAPFGAYTNDPHSVFYTIELNPR